MGFSIKTPHDGWIIMVMMNDGRVIMVIVVVVMLERGPLLSIVIGSKM